MTNKGLGIDLYVMQIEEGVYIASLDCPFNHPDGNTYSLSVYLRRVNAATEQYARIHGDQLPLVRDLGNLKPVFIRQPH